MRNLHSATKVEGRMSNAPSKVSRCRIPLRGSLLLTLVVTALAGCQKAPRDVAPSAPPPIDEARIAAAESNSEWLSYGRTYSEQRYSPLKSINTDNVTQLGLAWYAEFQADRGMEGTPLIADGVLYDTTSWSHVYALDARTGAIKWHYNPKVDGQKGKDACCDVVNRGVALWKDKVYVGALDGRLIAIEAATGKEVWSQQTTDPSWPYTITGAPRVVKGKVLIGNGGAEFGVRGYISAYDAETGKLAWRFYATPNPDGKPDGAASDKVFAEKAAATWSGSGWKKTGGGGTPWDAIVYDPQTDLVYVGMGNGSPWSHVARSDGKGDNLFLSSIVALRAETGEYVWHYQVNPGESWDYTATQPIMTADLTINGAKRHVVMQAPKNGFFYVLDAVDGKLLSAEKFVPVNWAERIDLATGRPVENPAARYPNGQRATVYPGAAGAHSWTPMSFDPVAGLVFIPAMVTSQNYQHDPNWIFIKGSWNLAQDGSSSGAPRIAPARNPSPLAPPNPPPTVNGLSMKAGQLIAWDPVKQEARWKHTQDSTFAGTLATAGGLVFSASGRDLSAYASKEGTKLWSHRTAAVIIAPPITYELDGEQYVAVNVGFGSVAAMTRGAYPRRPGRLYVYKLGGTATAPEFAPSFPRPPIDVASATASVGNVVRGGQRFYKYCVYCHVGGVYTPDLRTSPYIMTPDSFKSVVHEGALRARGMANFSELLSESDVEDIRAYLLQEAGK